MLMVSRAGNPICHGLRRGKREWLYDKIRRCKFCDIERATHSIFHVLLRSCPTLMHRPVPLGKKHFDELMHYGKGDWQMDWKMASKYGNIFHRK